MSFLIGLRSTSDPKGWRHVAGRSSMPHWSLFPNSETRGFIRGYAITPANIHDSQRIPQVLDPENRIHEKGSCCHPLSEEAKARNKVRSSVRVRVEHVFAAIATGMRVKPTRRIGLVRTKAWWGLRNLIYNLLRYLHCSSRPLPAA